MEKGLREDIRYCWQKLRVSCSLWTLVRKGLYKLVNMCEVGRDLYGVRRDFYENNPYCRPRTSTGTNNDELCNYQDLKGLKKSA